MLKPRGLVKIRHWLNLESPTIGSSRLWTASMCMLDNVFVVACEEHEERDAEQWVKPLRSVWVSVARCKQMLRWREETFRSISKWIQTWGLDLAHELALRYPITESCWRPAPGEAHFIWIWRSSDTTATPAELKSTRTPLHGASHQHRNIAAEGTPETQHLQSITEEINTANHRRRSSGDPAPANITEEEATMDPYLYCRHRKLQQKAEPIVAARGSRPIHPKNIKNPLIDLLRHYIQER